MALSHGAIEGIKKGDIANEPVTVKVSSLAALGTGNKRFKCNVSDGAGSMEAVLGSEAAKLAAAGDLQEGGVFTMRDYVVNVINDAQKLVITGCTVVESGQAPAAVKTEDGAEPMKVEEAPLVKAEPGSATPAAQPRSGASALDRAEQPPATPASQLKSASSSMIASPSPFVNRSARKACQPICALNPYNNDWTIRAKVASKTPLRRFEKNGQTNSVGTLEVVDDQGTTIEITLWRGVADKFYDHIEEGQVYYFRRGTVKLSQGKFKSARNDYIISMDTGSDIEQAADQDSSRMQARLKYIPIEQLVHYAGKKVLVDVLGVVTNVGPMRSIKRKQDGTEFFCRDVTIADAGGRTVGLTLWGDSAEVQGAELEQSEDAIVSVSSCRVGDFNGVSLSSGSRSAIAINPDSPQAEALRAWWNAEGRSSALSPLTQEQRQSGRGAQERTTIAQLVVPKEELPPADAKAQWHTLVAVIAQIDPNQAMYYEACPDNNRKVTKQDDGWYCEYDSKVYPNMVRRYVMLTKCMDASGELNISMFNEQAEQILGMTADELAALKESEGVEGYEAVLKSAQWKEWEMRVQSKSQSYQNELRQRVSANSLKPVNYIDESRLLIAQIEKLAVAA